jgi:3-oxoacyl-[acyl-carrier-protein] synthase-3
MTAEKLLAKKDKVEMSGREIFKYAVNKMVETSKNVIASAGLTLTDVDWMIPHQANRRIIEAAAKRLEVKLENIVINIERYGNTSSASIPIALSETIERGTIHKGDVILFTGFGGGLSWGSIAWRWDA